MNLNIEIYGSSALLQGAFIKKQRLPPSFEAHQNQIHKELGL